MRPGTKDGSLCRDEFWRIVGESRSSANVAQCRGNQDRQLAALTEALERMTPQEIIAFRDHFGDALDAAYRADLWAVADLLDHGCSDDAFIDFRSALVAMGRAVFETALREPDTIWKAFEDPAVEGLFFERFRYVPAKVYEKLTGEAIPDGRPPADLKGALWKDDRELQERFPSTWDRVRNR